MMSSDSCATVSLRLRVSLRDVQVRANSIHGKAAAAAVDRMPCSAAIGVGVGGDRQQAVQRGQELLHGEPSNKATAKWTANEVNVVFMAIVPVSYY
jgi:hypothetical protein